MAISPIKKFTKKVFGAQGVKNPPEPFPGGPEWNLRKAILKSIPVYGAPGAYLYGYSWKFDSRRELYKALHQHPNSIVTFLEQEAPKYTTRTEALVSQTQGNKWNNIVKTLAWVQDCANLMTCETLPSESFFSNEDNYLYKGPLTDAEKAVNAENKRTREEEAAANGEAQPKEQEEHEKIADEGNAAPANGQSRKELYFRFLRKKGSGFTSGSSTRRSDGSWMSRSLSGLFHRRSSNQSTTENDDSQPSPTGSRQIIIDESSNRVEEVEAGESDSASARQQQILSDRFFARAGLCSPSIIKAQGLENES